MASRSKTRLCAPLLSLAVTVASLPAPACGLLGCFHQLHAAFQVANFVTSSRGHKTSTSASSHIEVGPHHCEGGTVEHGERAVSSGPIATPVCLKTLRGCTRAECRKAVSIAVPSSVVEFSPLHLTHRVQGTALSFRALSQEQPQPVPIDSGQPSAAQPLRI